MCIRDSYQDKYQSLYQAQKDLKNGLMTGSTRKTFLDKFPDLAKYAGNTEDLSSAIDDLMDSMDSDVTNQFTDAIEALRDAGEDANADALQKYVDDVIAGAHDIEGAYKKIAGLKIPTPQYEAAKDASSTAVSYTHLFFFSSSRVKVLCLLSSVNLISEILVAFLGSGFGCCL